MGISKSKAIINHYTFFVISTILKTKNTKISIKQFDPIFCNINLHLISLFLCLESVKLLFWYLQKWQRISIKARYIIIFYV